MPIPWLGIIDAVIGVSNIARGRVRPPAEAPLAPGSGALGPLETRLAGVMVAALKEVFDRDSRRLELEREQLELERQRAERALKLELLRQAGDREIGRLRLIAGFAVATWVGTLFFSVRLVDGGLGVRAMLGGGWGLLLASLGCALTGQSRVSGALGQSDGAMSGRTELSSGVPGAVAPWLIVAGLALVGLAVLVA